MAGYKTYLFTYNFDGATWQLPIKAQTPEEAKARLDRLHYAQYSGELVAAVPVHSGLNRLFHAIRRFFRSNQ